VTASRVRVGVQLRFDITETQAHGTTSRTSEPSNITSRIDSSNDPTQLFAPIARNPFQMLVSALLVDICVHDEPMSLRKAVAICLFTTLYVLEFSPPLVSRPALSTVPARDAYIFQHCLIHGLSYEGPKAIAAHSSHKFLKVSTTEGLCDVRDSKANKNTRQLRRQQKPTLRTAAIRALHTY
jgi:hypothetical protein